MCPSPLSLRCDMCTVHFALGVTNVSSALYFRYDRSIQCIL